MADTRHFEPHWGGELFVAVNWLQIYWQDFAEAFYCLLQAWELFIRGTLPITAHVNYIVLEVKLVAAYILRTYYAFDRWFSGSLVHIRHHDPPTTSGSFHDIKSDCMHAY